MVKAGFPVAHNQPFAWVTTQEAYWYSRYILSYVFAQSHLGVSMIHGPYWTLKAQEHHRKNRLQRDRGEQVPANKDILLGVYLPMFYKRTGFPRLFDDAAPTYLQYASGDPHFTGPIDISDSFHDPMSGKKGNWGVPRYFIDWRNTRWSHDSMEVAFDLGAIAQTVKKQFLWVEYFYHSDHTEASPSNPAVEIPLLGNDAEEGFRGTMLTHAGFNAMLKAKTAFFYDPEKKRLGGIDPRRYDPGKGLKYLPHRVIPSMLYVGDLPERVWALDRVDDATSQLWDQSSWLWATTEYEWLGVRFDGKAFTDNPPVDAGIIERQTVDVAQGLGNVLVQNIEAMHTHKGVLVSEWNPKEGTGDVLEMRDAALATVALFEFVDRRLTAPARPELGPSDIDTRAERVLRSTGDFLLEVQGGDGSFRPAYDVTSSKGIGDADVAAPNWWAIRALVAAYHRTEEEKYRQAARRVWTYLEDNFWSEAHGLYRTRAGDDTVVLTPLEVGATMGAMRELMFATPLHELSPFLERFTRWFVQTMDSSGFQMAEDNRTGELAYGAQNPDEDGDGIPFIRYGHGRYGVAPVPASRVAVNLGGAENRRFALLKGERFKPERFNRVSYGYTSSPSVRLGKDYQASTAPLVAAIGSAGARPRFGAEGEVKGPVVSREPMERFNGTLIPLPATRPISRGSDLNGRELFERNCAVCHGSDGEGITAWISLANVASQGGDAVFEVPKKGRFENGMPPWGSGADDLAAVLTDDEIWRIVDYITTVLFPTSSAESRPSSGSTMSSGQK
jgi:mono/diheme cytochrome c family protein